MDSGTLTVEWTAEERNVPYTGLLIPGSKYTLPRALAQEFIDEGSAIEVEQED